MHRLYKQNATIRRREKTRKAEDKKLKIATTRRTTKPLEMRN